jgi:hypothetical protein
MQKIPIVRPFAGIFPEQPGIRQASYEAVTNF